MKRRSLGSRLAGAAIGLGAFFAFSWIFLPQKVELIVTVPAEHADVSSMDVRIEALPAGTEAYRGRRTRPEPGRSVLFETRLPRGEYRIRAWPRDGGEALGARFTFDGEDHLELKLTPAP